MGKLKKAQEYTVEILRRLIRVSDAREASQIVSEIIRRTGAGGSDIGDTFPVREDGTIIGYVSYNGKVWMGSPEEGERAELVYDPFKDDAHEPEIPLAPEFRFTMPRGTWKEKAVAFVRAILQNVDDFFNNMISYEEFGKRQQRIWDAVTASGERVDEEVALLLRSRPR